MKKMMTAMLAALALSLFAAPGHASRGDEPAVYQGRVNHVGDDAVLRMAYRGGQIRVKPRNLSAGDAPYDKLLGTYIRILSPEWRDGYLEGCLEMDSGKPRAPIGG